MPAPNGSSRSTTPATGPTWCSATRLDASDQYGRSGSGYELDVLNHREGIEELLSIPGQKAAARGWTRILTPDWSAVAVDWDGVHLSWLGYLTTDGTAVTLEDGSVTMLRNWGSERTVWLHPVFIHAELLPIPAQHFGDGPRPRSPEDNAWRREGEDLHRWALKGRR